MCMCTCEFVHPSHLLQSACFVVFADDASIIGSTSNGHIGPKTIAYIERFCFVVLSLLFLVSCLYFMRQCTWFIWYKFRHDHYVDGYVYIEMCACRRLYMPLQTLVLRIPQGRFVLCVLCVCEVCVCSNDLCHILFTQKKFCPLLISYASHLINWKWN